LALKLVIILKLTRSFLQIIISKVLDTNLWVLLRQATHRFHKAVLESTLII